MPDPFLTSATSADAIADARVARHEERVAPHRGVRSPRHPFRHELLLRDAEDLLGDDELDKLLEVIAEDVGKAWSK